MHTDSFKWERASEGDIVCVGFINAGGLQKHGPGLGAPLLFLKYILVCDPI